MLNKTSGTNRIKISKQQPCPGLTPSAYAFRPHNVRQKEIMNRIAEHFKNVQASLLALYDDSSAATHTVVTGSLREGFIRAVLQGHLPATASWSSGQIVGHAPKTEPSGQLDIILHSGELPQIFIHDGYIRLVPSDACIAVVEVKSEITTGKIGKKKATDVMSGALASLIKAKKVLRNAGQNSQTNTPFHIVAFSTKVSARKVIEFVYDYLDHHKLAHAEYWPESIVILKGAKKTEPNGYGIFKDSSHVRMPKSATTEAFKADIAGLTAKKVLGYEALAVLVALLANQAAGFPADKFRFEDYIYEK